MRKIFQKWLTKISNLEENFVKIGIKMANFTDVYIHIMMQIFMSKYKRHHLQLYIIEYSLFSILMVLSLFSQTQQAPGSDFRKVGKSQNK